MKDLQTWIDKGLLEKFLLGTVDRPLAAEIAEAARRFTEVREAIRATEKALKQRALAAAAQQDPEQLLHSGKLEDYVRGGLTLEERQQVEMMAMVFPEVNQAVDLIRRAFVEKTLEEIKRRDPQAFIDSEAVMDYIRGELGEEERQVVEQMAFAHPLVRDELTALQQVDEQLVKGLATSPPLRARQRFLDFMEEAEREEHEPIIIRPPMLHPQSVPTDFNHWVEQEGMQPGEYDNVHVVPLDANPECLTLLVWVKSVIAEEVHLDSIEKFLVLEGTCDIDVEGHVHSLKAGDHMSIPKYKRHTVHVTSPSPCKLIVQQIAA